jgi:hypothetical protein
LSSVEISAGKRELAYTMLLAVNVFSFVFDVIRVGIDSLSMSSPFSITRTLVRFLEFNALE